MKFIEVLSSLLILGDSLNLDASTVSNAATENEIKQIRFSERLILAELAKTISSKAA